MKKKVKFKDLTLKEMREICDKCECENCPLSFYCEYSVFDIIRGTENLISVLESEVEVDE